MDAAVPSAADGPDGAVRPSLRPAVAPGARRPDRIAPGLVAGLAVLTAAATLLLAAPLVSDPPPSSFVLDDAYVSLRYAANWADGHGPVWNPGADPVEGSTSFAWVVVNAVAIRLGLAAEAAGRVLCLLALAGVAVLVVAATRRRPTALRLAAYAALALNPAFLVVAVQGMETGAAALALLALTLAFLGAVERGGTAVTVGFHALGLLAAATRPEAAVVYVVLLGGLLVQRREELRRQVLLAVVVAVLPGAAYFAWRWGFYGHPLPNPFYVKHGGGAVDPQAVRNVALYAAVLLGLPAALLAVGVSTGRRPAGTARWPPTAPSWPALGVAVAALLALLAVTTTFHPIQAHLFRYQMPTLPALLVLGVLAAGRAPRFPRTWVGRVPVLLLAVVPLLTWPAASAEIAQRWQYDRVEVGRALAGVGAGGGRPTMFVSEAGALPLVSGWRAEDRLGLVSEHVARHGMTERHLRALRPDVVAVFARLRAPGLGPPLRRYAAAAGYELVTIVRKTSPDRVPIGDAVHLYLVHPRSPVHDEVCARLTALESVLHLDRAHAERIATSLGLVRSCSPPAVDPDTAPG